MNPNRTGFNCVSCFMLQSAVSIFGLQCQWSLSITQCDMALVDGHLLQKTHDLCDFLNVVNFYTVAEKLCLTARHCMHI